MKHSVDAITRRAVQVQAYMHIILMRPVNNGINGGYPLFIDLIDFLLCNIAAAIEFEVSRIRNRQPDKIKTPVVHPLKVFFGSGMLKRNRVRNKEIEQIEAFPFGQFIFGRNRSAALRHPGNGSACH